MDGDFWGGIAILVVAGGVGVFCVFGAVVGRRRGRTTSGGVVFLVLIGAVFLAGGVAGFVALTLTPRHNGNLLVIRKYEIDRAKASVVYRVVTNSGTYEATGQGLYDSLRVGRSYRCSVLGGYTGAPSLFRIQATLESCRAA